MEQTMCNEIERYTAFLHENEKADGIKVYRGFLFHCKAVHLRI